MQSIKDFMTDSLVTLGEWIHLRLKEKGKTQAWLAKKIGVQPPQVSRIISGSSIPSLKTLSAIAEALGKSRTQVFRVAGYVEKLPKMEECKEQILYEISDLAEQEIEEILAYIQMKKSLKKHNGKQKD